MQPQSRSKFLDYLFPKKGYITVPAIFFLNLLLYIAVSIYDRNFWFPSSETILKFGGNANFLTLDGQWWRLITSTFLHFGLLHFAVNMLALVQLGFILEKFIGSSRLASVYFFTGLSAGIISTWWHSWSVGAGASGAIAGLFGFFLALVTTPFIQKENRWPLLKSIGITILINAIIGLQVNVDNAAHLGGLLSGILSGYILFFIYKTGTEKRKLIFNGIMIILSLGILLGIYPALSREPVQVAKLLDKIETQRQTLLNNYYSPGKTKANPGENLLLNKWNELEIYSKKLSELNLAPEVKKVNDNFRKEFELRRKEIFLIKQIREGNMSYRSELNSVQNQLKLLQKQNEEE